MMINFIGLKIMNSQFIEIMRVGEIGQKNAREKSGRKLKELNNIPSLNYPSILLSLYLISYFLLLFSHLLVPIVQNFGDDVFCSKTNREPDNQNYRIC